MVIAYLPRGDITADSAELLVNPVNAVGVMGKGVALAFKERWPGILDDYRAACSSGRLAAGGCLLFPLPDGRLWAALATKAHWRAPSRYEWVEAGLAELAWRAKQAGVGTIALPQVGCGNGGLDWRLVEPIMRAALKDFDLRVYAATPSTTGEARLPRRR